MEGDLQKFLSLPTPPAPVQLEKIDGVWWSLGKKENKEFACVEDLNASVRPYRANLSTSNGTRFLVEFCRARNSHGSHEKFHAGSCDALPILSWIRVGIPDLIRSPQSLSWGIRYRPSEFAMLSEFFVKAICYPNRDWITSDEAGDQRLGEDLSRT